MSRSRALLVFVALLAAASPAQGQTRYETGRFTVELPRGVARLELARAVEKPASSFEAYVSRSSMGVVMVMRSLPRGRTGHGIADSAAVDRLMEESPARIRQILSAPMDTSARARRMFREIASDTALATRRAHLQTIRQVWGGVHPWLRMEGEGHEIVTEDRVTHRIPVTVTGEGPPLRGIADLSLSRRPGVEMWMVMYVAPERTPAVEAAAARMLDSFRLKPVASGAAPPG